MRATSMSWVNLTLAIITMAWLTACNPVVDAPVNDNTPDVNPNNNTNDNLSPDDELDDNANDNDADDEPNDGGMPDDNPDDGSDQPDDGVDEDPDSGGDNDTSGDEAMPDFAVLDVNPTSPRYNEEVSPRDYIGQISAWYFGHST